MYFFCIFADFVADFPNFKWFRQIWSCEITTFIRVSARNKEQAQIATLDIVEQYKCPGCYFVH